jgi:hypothetical protein
MGPIEYLCDTYTYYNTINLPCLYLVYTLVYYGTRVNVRDLIAY